VPETPEIETDKLDENIHEELERAGGSLLKAIALSTALFAALAAVAALRAGSTVNEALVLKTEATRLQAEASDNIGVVMDCAGQTAAIVIRRRAPTLRPRAGCNRAGRARKRS
jgi:hypothetical protein